MPGFYCTLDGMSLARAMATVGGLTLLSRVAGFIRDVLTAAILGAGPIADAFFIALKLPNFFRRITAEGAFSYAFVPIYTKTQEKEGVEKATEFSNQALTTMLVFLVPFTIIMLFAMPWVLYGLAPGFEPGTDRYQAALEMTRITFPYLILMSMTSLVGGIMNANGRFAPFAFTPVLFNGCLIVALLCFTDVTETVGHAMSWAVAVAGVVQFLWMYVSLRRAGFSLRLVSNFKTAKVKKLFSLMGPAAFGAGITQINLFIDVILASFLPVGSISYLYYADRLHQLPLSVVGIAIGTALLPMLSRALEGNKHVEAENLFNRSVEFSLILAVPAAVALIVIPQELITILFQRGNFGAFEAEQTVRALQAFVVGLPAYVLAKVFSTVFFSREDTKTPVKISIVATLVNIGLSLILIHWLAHVGIALATSVAGWINVIALFILAKKRKFVSFDKKLKKNAVKVLMGTFLMGITLWFGKDFFHSWIFGTENLVRITGLILLIAAGSIVYGISMFGFGVVNKKALKSYLKRKDKKPNEIPS